MWYKKTKNILILSIIGLIVLRIISLFLIYYLPHLEYFRYGKYFSVFKGGDDLGYYKLARMIYGFDFQKHPWTLGYPFTIVPFLFVFGNGFSDIFFPLTIFNGVVLYSFSIILIVLTTFFIFKKTSQAIAAGLGFVLFPFLFYIFRDFGPHFRTATWNDYNFFQANWLTIMSDPLSSFLVYTLIFLLILGTRKNFNFFYYFLFGSLSGFSVMVRVSNILIGFISVFIIILYKRYKNLVVYIFSSIIGFTPQFVYNAVFFGSPIRFGYEEAYKDWVAMGAAVRPAFSFFNFSHLITRAVEYSILILPVFVFIFFTMVFGTIYIYRKNNFKFSLIVLLWFLFPTMFYAFFTTGQTTIRYYMPAVPAFIILFLASASYFYDKIKFKLIYQDNLKQMFLRK